jgi:hypothetical protein
VTKDEALAYKSRFEAINNLEIEELRSMSAEAKFAQLAWLMASAKETGWDLKLAEEVAEVRERWLKLKGRLKSD